MMVGGRAERARKKDGVGALGHFSHRKKPEKRHFAKGGLKKLMSMYVCTYVRGRRHGVQAKILVCTSSVLFNRSTITYCNLVVCFTNFRLYQGSILLVSL